MALHEGSLRETSLRETSQQLFNVLSEEDLKEFLENFEDRFERFEINARILTVMEKRTKESGDKKFGGRTHSTSKIEVWEFFQSPPISPTPEGKTPTKRGTAHQKPRQFRVVKQFSHARYLHSLVVVPGTTKGAIFYMKSSEGIVKFKETGDIFTSEVFAEDKYAHPEFATSDGSLFCTRIKGSSLIRFSPTGEMTERKFAGEGVGEVFPLHIQGRDFVGIERERSFIVLSAEDLSEFDRVPAVVGGERPTRAFISRDKFMTDEAANSSALVWRYVPPLPGEPHGRIENLGIGPADAINTIGDDLIFDGIDEVRGIDIWAPSGKNYEGGETHYDKVQTLDTEVPSDDFEMFSPAENLFLVRGELWKDSSTARGEWSDQRTSFKRIQDFTTDGIYVLPPSEFARGKAVELLDSLYLPVHKDILRVIVEFAAVKVR